MKRTHEEIQAIYDYARRVGKEVYTMIPKGWVITEGSMTQPRGSEWINNHESRFKGKRKSALLIK